MPKRFLFSVVLCLGFISCEKNISIRLDSTASQVVVDASIESARYPVVVLSTSFSYFSKIDAATLAATFIHGADVSVSNGLQTMKLFEDSVLNDSSGFEVYYYTTTQASGQTAFPGEIGGRYALTIVTGGKTYQATTTIPDSKKTLDSLWWGPVPHAKDSTEVIVYAKLTDPKGFGDYVRYYTQLNGGPYLPGPNSVFDDQIVDGTTYTVQVGKGIDRNATQNSSDDSDFFHRGDTVGVKFANIDKATYDFWRTMEYNYQAIGNPFSTPVEVLGNVSNGALGYFGGYAVTYRSLTIPR